MKRFLVCLMLIGISLIGLCDVGAISTTEANESIDGNRKCSLVLNYSYDDYKFDNISIKIYKVASVSNDFQYQLSSNFSSYPVSVNGIKSIEEWDILENTLNSYIVADAIEETLYYSIQSNTLKIENLDAGLYFVKTEKIDTEDYTLIFDNFLISVPNLGDDGYWDYDVIVYPKAEEYIPKYEKINYTVMKQWKDDGINRPDDIDIDIYKDGILIGSQVLSSANNFIYSWEVDDDGSEWSVVERNIPSGYNVSILKKDKNFIIINTDSDYKEDNPKTFDDINLFLYLLIASLVGIILLIVSLFKKKMIE